MPHCVAGDNLTVQCQIREALANAFVHRDYSIGGGSVGVVVYDDRLEIWPAGQLHFGLTPDILFGPHESKPWNPMIASVFYRRGIIETWDGEFKKLRVCCGRLVRRFLS